MAVSGLHGPGISLEISNVGSLVFFDREIMNWRQKWEPPLALSRPAGTKDETTVNWAQISNRRYVDSDTLQGS